ncbi:virulence RhuM family protein [bacterium]|nr:virulence RhuM family protein [bacterium]
MSKNNSQFTTHHSPLIRNSTSEFLIFTSQDGSNSLEARYEDETIWLTQKLMGELFEIQTNTINYHLKEIFKSGEADENRTIRKFRIVQTEGKRKVEHLVDFYNLDAIISVGYSLLRYRVNV